MPKQVKKPKLTAADRQLTDSHNREALRKSLNVLFRAKKKFNAAVDVVITHATVLTEGKP